MGAFSLLAINWVVAWVLYRAPKATVLLAGTKATLVSDGVVDEDQLKKQSLTHEDLISVLNKNGFNDPSDVQTCVLEPNGTFFVEGKKQTGEEMERQGIIRALAELTVEVKALRREMEAKG